MVAFLFVLLFCLDLQNLHQQCCQAKEIQYSYKNVSEYNNDGFARNLATAPGKLAILAAGSLELAVPPRIYVGNGKKLTPPFGTEFWFYFIDMTEDFLAVGSWLTPAVLVYQASLPYKLIATIPLRGTVRNLKITEKNTVVVVIAYDDEHSQEHHCDVLVYHYDGADSWHLSQTLKTQDYPQPVLGLAVNENHLVVQSFYNRPPFKVLWVFQKIKGLWVRRQEILDPHALPYCFGDSMVLDGDKLAVTSFAGDQPPNGTTIVYTYQFSHASGKWILESTLDIPGKYAFPAVVPAMKKDILVMTVNDKRQPEVCSVVYKLSKPTFSRDGIQTWRLVATLKTKGDPAMIGDHWHSAVRIEGDKVYTGRCVEEPSTDVGKVFHHDISELSYD